MKSSMWFASFRRQVKRDMRERQVKNYHVVLFIIILLLAGFGESIFECIYNLF